MTDSSISPEHQKLIDAIQSYKLELVYSTRDRTFIRIDKILDKLAEIVPEHYIVWEKKYMENITNV